MLKSPRIQNDYTWALQAESAGRRIQFAYTNSETARKLMQINCDLLH